MICDVLYIFISFFFSPLNLGMQFPFWQFVCFVPVAPPVDPAESPEMDEKLIVQCIWMGVPSDLSTKIAQSLEQFLAFKRLASCAAICQFTQSLHQNANL